jgi:predicted phage terminase large subunit-like protein
MTAAHIDIAELIKVVQALPQDKRDSLAMMPGVREHLGANCVLTHRQEEAEYLLDSPATHCMLFGGSRSGKTFLLMRKIIARAIKCVSRHAVMRYRFNHVVASVALDTLPKVMQLCYPTLVEHCKLDRSMWVYRFPNGSEIWFSGLDEKERTEKILGLEYSTIFLNECSQIPYDSRTLAVTRLAQKNELPRKMLYDCNPPSRRHWTHLLFIDKIDPSRNQPLVDRDNYEAMLINPEHNRANLPAEYLGDLDKLDERRRRRFLLGLFSDDDETALWSPEMLDKGRLLDRAPPTMQRTIVAVDPSGCSGPEDLRSDEVGIVVVGIGDDGRGYVLEDLSGRYGPDHWKTIVASAYERHGASAVVAEVNYGGAMVGEVMRTAAVRQPIVFRPVTASRGKIIRAEPISALFEQGRISLVGRFPDMEYQLCAMTVSGYVGHRSPDRADAMIWGLSELFPAMARTARGVNRAPRIVLGYAKVKKGNRQ